MSRHFIVAVLLVVGAALGVFYALHHGMKAKAATPVGEVKSVIVKFKDTPTVTATTPVGRSEQQDAIKQANRELSDVGGGYIQKTREFANLPYAVYDVDAAGEKALKADPRVESVSDDQVLKPLTDTPIPTIGGSASTGFSDGTSNYTGNGYAVAVIDTGVDKNHSALAGKVIAEACFGVNHSYSNADEISLCPGQATFSKAAGSGQDCTITGCGHGTEVAGSAAMLPMNIDIDSDGTPETLSGSAKDAKIIAIKIVSEYQEKTGPDVCGDGATLSTCAVPIESSYLAALDYVATLSASKPIASVNLSIGSPTQFASTDSECNAYGSGISAYNSAATSLRAHNIAPIVAAGNSGDNPSYFNKISTPACASKAIAVAATNIKGTAIASYSNNSALTDLLAPGGDYDGTNADTVMWLPKNGTTGTFSGGEGTSFAAPMVAGAFAVLREKHPNASVDSLLSLLQNTGTAVTDTRSGYTVGAKKLIKIDAALAASPLPVINSFTGPATVQNEGDSMQVALDVSNSTKCTLNNGVGTVWTSGTGTTTKTVPVKASYTLTCNNAYGDVVTKTLATATNAAPTKPASLTGDKNISAGTYLLSWGASTDADGVANYKVYQNGTLVATLANTVLSYKFTGLQNGQKYTFAVVAVDTLGASSTASTSLTFAAQAVAVSSTGKGGVTAPNTGILPLQSVGLWQLVAMIGGVIATSFTVYKFQFATSKK